MEKLLAADGLIWSSPNYIKNVTAQLKTLFDRSSLIVHEQSSDRKYGFSFTTAGNEEVDFVLDIMNNYMINCGGIIIGGVGYAIAQGPSALLAVIEKSQKMGKDLVEAIKKRRQCSEQEDAHKAWRERFKYVLIADKDHWTHNCDYWAEKGWIQE